VTDTPSALGEIAAMRIQAAEHRARITSNSPAAVDWLIRYFSAWWQAEPVCAGAHEDVTVRVDALVDQGCYEHISATVDGLAHTTVTYARQPLRVARQNGALLAHGEGLAYRVGAEGHITIAVADPGLAEHAASAAGRLAREALRGALARDGWVLLHASAAVQDGRAILAFGGKGSGKTSTVLQLGRAYRWAALANDRLFARSGTNGAVELLPWPAAAAIGLGLLDAGGWYDAVAVAAASGELHSSTSKTALAALRAGARTPPHDGEREAKAQLYPDQFTSLLGLPLATTARAAALVFPAIDLNAAPTIHPGGRELHDDDTFAAATEDRYHNVFALRQPESTAARTAIFDRLHRLPRYTLTLSANLADNTPVLGGVHHTVVEDPRPG